MVAQIDTVSAASLASICERYAVRKLSVFGSALRSDFRPDSDLDILVEFEPGQTPGLGFFTLQAELSQLFERDVDLNTPNCLPTTFRRQVCQEAQILYAAP